MDTELPGDLVHPRFSQVAQWIGHRYAKRTFTMKRFLTTGAALSMFAAIAGTGAMAAPGHDVHSTPPHAINAALPHDMHNDAHADAHDDHNNNNHGASHADWKKGGHIQQNDWKRGQAVNYRDHHLQAPPHGYEWRQVDGNYVLAAAATGLIASIILAGH
jgi:Ni/Co efflux regulator RcnB